MAKLTPAEIEKKVAEAKHRAQYKGYLQSRRWSAKRQAKLESVSYTCERRKHGRKF